MLLHVLKISAVLYPLWSVISIPGGAAVVTEWPKSSYQWSERRGKANEIFVVEVEEKNKPNKACNGSG